MSTQDSVILLAYDSVKIGKPKIVADNKRFLKIEAVISKAGVYRYDDGWALKSAAELRKAARTARYAKLTLDDHPETKVIMSQSQLFGGVERPFFDNNKIRAVLAFDKLVTPENTLKKVRAGELQDVSIGFYYRADWTPGWHVDVNTGKPRHYDYVMRDIVVDHVVGGVGPGMMGRCRYPQCGIGVDTALKQVCYDQDIVGKRGDQWCVFHCNADGSRGGVIKCFSGPDAHEKALAMHRAIMARKSKGSAAMIKSLSTLGVDIMKMDAESYSLLFGDAEKPPKAWMDACMSKAESFADEPGAYCMWLWNEGPAELKSSMGGSSVSSYGDGKMGQDQETEYAKCVREKKEAGKTDEEAREACKELKTDQEEKTEAYQQCIAAKKAEGMTQEAAEKACEALKPTAGDQLQTQWDQCIVKYTNLGLSQEEAKQKCKEDGLTEPEAAEDQEGEPVAQPVPSTEEVLPTELEVCIAARMEGQGESAEAAKKWCEDELAGLHQPAEEIVDSIQRLKAKEAALNRR